MDVTPLLQSQVIRALLVAVAGLGGLIARKLGFQFDDDFWNQFIDALLLILTTGAALWAGWARATKVTPPLTQVAADKTEAAKQGGFARPGMLAFVLAGALLAIVGCTHTRDAYKAAAQSDNKLEATAYVVSEHYAAVLKEAATLKSSGSLQGAALIAVQRADDAVRPVIIGNPATRTPGLIDLVSAYKLVHDAKSEAALQAALNSAVVKLSDLINALKRR